MNVYHGSKLIINKPLYKGSNPKNDYGPAFYVTADLSAAKSWACKNEKLGIVNAYSLRKEQFDNFKILDLTDGTKNSVLNWLAILMHFRTLNNALVKRYGQILTWLEKFYIDVDNYDVIKGYRADDAYFRFPINFIEGQLSYDDLKKAFELGSLGIQYAFISEKAIKSLKFEKTIDCEDYFIGHYFKNVQKATQEYNELLLKEQDKNKTYVFDLMRKENE